MQCDLFCCQTQTTFGPGLWLQIGPSHDSLFLSGGMKTSNQGPGRFFIHRCACRWRNGQNHPDLLDWPRRGKWTMYLSHPSNNLIGFKGDGGTGTICTSQRGWLLHTDPTNLSSTGSATTIPSSPTSWDKRLSCFFLRLCAESFSMELLRCLDIAL